MYGVFVLTGVLDNQNDKKNLERVTTILQSDEIQKDTFTVKDVTGDKKPDIILTKKDGSEVVLDIYNQTIEE